MKSKKNFFCQRFYNEKSSCWPNSRGKRRMSAGTDDSATWRSSRPRQMCVYAKDGASCRMRWQFENESIVWGKCICMVTHNTETIMFSPLRLSYLNKLLLEIFNPKHKACRRRAHNQSINATSVWRYVRRKIFWNFILPEAVSLKQISKDSAAAGL